MSGITVLTETNSSALPRLIKMLQEYRKVGKKPMSDVVKKQAAELAYNLYNRSKEVAHPAEFFDSMPQQRGWKIDARLKHAKVSAWPGRDHVVKEIARRKKHRLFLAAGWLQVRKVYRRGMAELRPVSDRLGAVTLSIGTLGLPGSKNTLTLINKHPLAAEMHAKFGITRKALNDTTRNMIPYIRRKRDEIISKMEEVRKDGS